MRRREREGDRFLLVSVSLRNVAFFGATGGRSRVGSFGRGTSPPEERNGKKGENVLVDIDG